MTWRGLVVLLVLPLAGCDSGQDVRKGFAACRLAITDSDKRIATTLESDDDDFVVIHDGSLRDCMQSRGFAFNDEDPRCARIMGGALAPRCFRADGWISGLFRKKG
jgi:hypothetical protein